MATFGTFVSGQVLTAAELNTAGEFQTYTPTWTQSATITKTVNWARYTQLNKFVYVSMKMTASSAGTASNNILVGLPVTASANNWSLGTAQIVDESATPDLLTPLLVVYNSSTTATFYQTQVAQAIPFRETIASGDILYAQFVYEAD